MPSLQRMLFILGGAGALFFSACAQTQPPTVESPPENIVEHYRWCKLVVYRPTAIARFEGFWAKHHPAHEEYKDAEQINFVRLSAYRLAELYAAAGQKEKCLQMIGWLEAHDALVPSVLKS